MSNSLRTFYLLFFLCFCPNICHKNTARFLVFLLPQGQARAVAIGKVLVAGCRSRSALHHVPAVACDRHGAGVSPCQWKIVNMPMHCHVLPSIYSIEHSLSSVQDVSHSMGCFFATKHGSYFCLLYTEVLNMVHVVL